MTRDSRKTTTKGRSRETSRPTAARRRTGSARSTTVRSASPRPAGSSAGKGAAGSGRAVRKQRSPRSMRRLAVMGALIVFLAVIIAPTVRSYVSQRQHVSQLQAQVATQRADIASLKETKRKWSDPDYVAAQAGQRLGFAKPGKTLTVYVTDEKSKQVAERKSQEKQTWYGTIWKSVVASGAH